MSCVMLAAVAKGKVQYYTKFVLESSTAIWGVHKNFTRQQLNQRKVDAGSNGDEMNAATNDGKTRMQLCIRMYCLHK